MSDAERLDDLELELLRLKRRVAGIENRLDRVLDILLAVVESIKKLTDGDRNE